jgi:hypothetical protein
MSTKSATLAKSLHTVSVLVNVARELQRVADDSGRRFPEGAAGAVRAALVVLGYADAGDSEQTAADPHGLEAKAVALLSKEVAAEPPYMGPTARYMQGFQP